MGVIVLTKSSSFQGHFSVVIGVIIHLQSSSSPARKEHQAEAPAPHTFWQSYQKVLDH